MANAACARTVVLRVSLFCQIRMLYAGYPIGVTCSRPPALCCAGLELMDKANAPTKNL